MRVTYPVIIRDDGEVFESGEKYLLVEIPDLGLVTQGHDLPDALDMAYDIIGVTLAYWKDDGNKGEFPEASDVRELAKEYPLDVVTLVSVDLERYRLKNDGRSVRKNCTIPSWLNMAAEEAGVNFSEILQEGLKQHLGVD